MLNTRNAFTIHTHPDGQISIDTNAPWITDNNATPAPWRTGRTLKLDTDGHWWIEHLITGKSKKPAGFVPDPASPDNPKYGWLPTSRTTAALKSAANTAIKNHTSTLEVGKHELVGPGVNHNPHHLTAPTLYTHGAPLQGTELRDFNASTPFPRSYYAAAAWLKAHDAYLGLVWFGTGGYKGQTAKLLTQDLA